MSDVPESLKLLLKRFLISIPFFVLSFYLISRLSYAGPLLLAIPAFLLAGPISAIFTNPVGSVFFPEKRRKRGPVLMFSLPRSRMMEGDLEGAMELYRDMVLKDPGNTEIYVKMLELALLRMNRSDLAREIFHNGLRNLGDQEKKELLAENYTRYMNIFMDGEFQASSEQGEGD